MPVLSWVKKTVSQIDPQSKCLPHSQYEYQEMFVTNKLKSADFKHDTECLQPFTEDIYLDTLDMTQLHKYRKWRFWNCQYYYRKSLNA
jgi:hypothetical protein